MAYDGIITMKMVEELQFLAGGKIDRVWQPYRDQIVLGIHTREGNYKLFSSSGSGDARVNLTEENLVNPKTPFPFCMFLRKHLIGGRILSISQVASDRIIEMELETFNELGISVSKKMIFEIMGKHSNIILTERLDENQDNMDSSDNDNFRDDAETNHKNYDNSNLKYKILDSIKHISIDTSKVRQVLPGIIYTYPPAQDKIPFKEIAEKDFVNIPNDSKSILNSVGGISPAIAEELSLTSDPYGFINSLNDVKGGHIYLDDKNNPIEFHIASLSSYEGSTKRIDFDSISKCVDYFFINKSDTNKIKQKASTLSRHLESLIEKSELKLKKLNEDLISAQDSDNYRLYGELLTANLHMVKAGSKSVDIISYYDDKKVTIPLDPKYSPSKNAQNYFKKYGKSKTAVKEKENQIEETEKTIDYLNSVLEFLNRAEDSSSIDAIRDELIEEGYLKKNKPKGKREKYKASPHRFTSPSGFQVLVGRNNRENDELTFKLADKTDLWLHTKDIPGSHVIIKLNGNEPSSEDIYFASGIAAWFSKAKDSSQVPVDYVKVRLVKKPQGAKPGYVIFTGNKTVYVNPRDPNQG